MISKSKDLQHVLRISSVFQSSLKIFQVNTFELVNASISDIAIILFDSRERKFVNKIDESCVSPFRPQVPTMNLLKLLTQVCSRIERYDK